MDGPFSRGAYFGRSFLFILNLLLYEAQQYQLQSPMSGSHSYSNHNIHLFQSRFSCNQGWLAYQLQFSDPQHLVAGNRHS